MTQHNTSASQFDPRDLAGKRALVMGLGSFGGGIGATRFLAQRGCRITITDKRTPDQLAPSLAQLEDLPLTLHLAGHEPDDFSPTRHDFIVVNPAIPPDNPFLALAEKNHLPRTSEMNLFFQLCPAPIVAITGSNGKSTTAAMTHAVLVAATATTDNHHAARPYRRTWLGGNIGRENLLAQIDRIQPDDLVVLELSSFQLDDLARIQRSPHVALVTNLSPNHLDWHKTMPAYTHAKQNITRFQSNDDFLLLNAQDPALADWPGLSPATIRWYPDPPDLADAIDLAVPGRHNQLNAAAALTVADIFSVPDSLARDALKNFHALPHRLELVRTLHNVRYYNDSISTTPESTLVALDAFPSPKLLILGGYDKKIPLEPLAQRLVSCDTVHYVALIGHIAPQLAAAIDAAKQTLHADLPRYEILPTLDAAVHHCRQNAPAGSVVLLSPATASYDMFTNFQHRGQAFTDLVNQLA